MRNFIEEKIRSIQAQPDHVRTRTVIVCTIVVTIIVILIWAALLLPAQLRIAAH